MQIGPDTNFRANFFSPNNIKIVTIRFLRVLPFEELRCENGNCEEASYRVPEVNY